MEFLVTYKRKNREPWYLIIRGKGFKQWLKEQKEYGFSVEIIPTPTGTVLEIDTHGLGGWEKKVEEC